MPQTARTSQQVLLFIFFWFFTNVVLYFGLDFAELSKSPKRRLPSNQARRLFKPTSMNSSNNSVNARTQLRARLMAPPSVNSHSRYPLLVFLHGSGERGSDNERQLFGLPEQMAESPWRNQFPCYLLAPQCPDHSDWDMHSDEVISGVDQLLNQYQIDPNRVYLTGLSMGGYGCWKLIAHYPTLFAATAPICGGGDPKSAPQLIGVPIWAVHGDQDQSVPAERSREMIEAIRDAGGKMAIYTELKGVGHDSWTQTYRDPNGILKWMFQQRKETEWASRFDTRKNLDTGGASPEF